MKRKSLTSLTLFSTAAALSLGLAPKANALVTVFSANFNSPLYTDGVLNPGTDLTTPGQDNWLTASGGTSNAIAVSNSATNGFVSLTTSGQDLRRIFDNQVAFTSGSVWLDADVTVSAAQTAGDYAIHLSDGGTSNFNERIFFKSNGSGAFLMALGTGSGTPTYGTTPLTFGTTYHILARYDFVTGATNNDTGALFINPTTTDGSGDTAYVAATTIGTDATSISAVALRQGTAGNAATLTVDNLRVSSTAIPEPATLATLVGGLAVLGLRRRNRRA